MTIEKPPSATPLTLAEHSSKVLALLAATLLIMSVWCDYSYLAAVGPSFNEVPSLTAEHVRSAWTIHGGGADRCSHAGTLPTEDGTRIIRRRNPSGLIASNATIPGIHSEARDCYCYLMCGGEHFYIQRLWMDVHYFHSLLDRTSNLNREP
jgi:hypothetical protein